MADQTNDHDLLIELRTELRGLRDDVKDIRDNTTADIAMLKKDKADRVEVDFIHKKLDDDIEIRMRKVEECAIDPKDHSELIKSNNSNNIYLKWILLLVGILCIALIYHLTGYKI